MIPGIRLSVVFFTLFFVFVSGAHAALMMVAQGASFHPGTLSNDRTSLGDMNDPGFFAVAPQAISSDESLKIGRAIHERHEAQYLRREKLKVDQRLVREAQDISVDDAPVTLCQSGRTDVLVEEQFECGVNVDAGRGVRLYTNRGDDYAFLERTVDVTSNDVEVLIDHAVEFPTQQTLSVYALRDDVWVPVCTGLTSTRDGVTSRCDLSGFVKTYTPKQLSVRVESYAREGASLWTVNHFDVVAGTDDVVAAEPLAPPPTPVSGDAAPRTTPPGGSRTTLLEGQTPPPADTGDDGAATSEPPPSTRQGQADLGEGETIVTILPTFATAETTTPSQEGTTEESAAETDTSVETNENAPSSLTGAAVGAGSAVTGPLIAVLLLFAALWFSGFGRNVRKKPL